MARTAVRHQLRLVALPLLRREQHNHLPLPQRRRPHIPHRRPRPLPGLRPRAPSAHYRPIQAHVPLQRLRQVQMEAPRSPSRTRQPPEPAPLRLHPLQRHQYLHLRLHPLRPHRNAESDV